MSTVIGLTASIRRGDVEFLNEGSQGRVYQANQKTEEKLRRAERTAEGVRALAISRSTLIEVAGLSLRRLSKKTRPLWGGGGGGNIGQ